MSDQLLPQEYDFGPKMAEASALLGVQPDEVVSIKLRPIQTVGTLDQNYLTSSDYDTIDQEIKLSGVSVSHIGYVLDGNAFQLLLPDGRSVLYVQHETGPEIIMVLGIITAGAAAANQLIQLINTVCGIISKAHRSTGASSGAISIEQRLTKTQKIIKQVGETAEAGKKFVDSLTQLLT